MKKFILALVILLTSFSFNSCDKEELKEVTTKSIKQQDEYSYSDSSYDYGSFNSIGTFDGIQGRASRRTIPESVTYNQTPALNVPAEDTRPTVIITSGYYDNNRIDRFNYTISNIPRNLWGTNFTFRVNVQNLYMFNREVFAFTPVININHPTFRQNLVTEISITLPQFSSYFGNAEFFPSLSEVGLSYSSFRSHYVRTETGNYEVANYAGIRANVIPSSTYNINDALDGSFSWYLSDADRTRILNQINETKSFSVFTTGTSLLRNSLFPNYGKMIVAVQLNSNLKKFHSMKILSSFYYESKDKKFGFTSNYSTNLTYNTRYTRKDQNVFKTSFIFDINKVPKTHTIKIRSLKTGKTTNVILYRKSYHCGPYRGHNNDYQGAHNYDKSSYKNPF